MSEKIFIKPIEGLRVRMPDNPQRFLKAEGEAVAAASFWTRRIKEGSVKRVPVSAVEVKTKKKKNQEPSFNLEP